MAQIAVHVQSADRMMTFARGTENGIELTFADGCQGVIPFAEIPELGSLANLANIDLPNPYEVVLIHQDGRRVELPWDFARAFCDPSYQPRIQDVAADGRASIGRRIRRLREATHATQENLAASAGIGRVTLVRVERGDQSPTFDTLAAIARALGKPLSDLLVDESDG